MDTTYDCIIAGAGPTGLMLVCELATHHISVLILERNASPNHALKRAPLGMRGIMPNSIEAFYRRGMLDDIFTDASSGGHAPRLRRFEKTNEPFQHGGHFAGISLNANWVDLDEWKYTINGPSLVPGRTTIEALEKVLRDRAEGLGAKILWGSGFSEIVSRTGGSITISTTDGKEFTSQWLVGCDGGRSGVRHAAGFDFAGTSPRFTGYGLSCDLENASGLKPGFHAPPNFYVYMPSKRAGIPSVLHLADWDGGAFDRSAQPTEEHIEKILRRCTGNSEVVVAKLHDVGVWTDRCKQATMYRKGRVLLAGDAAHIHSPLGAQGLTLGIGDAMNLGWKLAATIRSEKAAGAVPSDDDLFLLNSYTAERHPAGKRIQDWTRSQVQILQPDEFGLASYNLIKDLAGTKEGNNLLLKKMWAIDQKYDLGSSHPLVGRSAPDFELGDGRRLGEVMRDGKAWLIEFGEKHLLEEVVAKDHAWVTYLATSAKDARSVQALLIRPDGIVAWAVDEGSVIDVESVKNVVQKWFANLDKLAIL